MYSARSWRRSKARCGRSPLRAYGRRRSTRRRRPSARTTGPSPRSDCRATGQRRKEAVAAGCRTGGQCAMDAAPHGGSWLYLLRGQQQLQPSARHGAWRQAGHTAGSLRSVGKHTQWRGTIRQSTRCGPPLRRIRPQSSDHKQTRARRQCSCAASEGSWGSTLGSTFLRGTEGTPLPSMNTGACQGPCIPQHPAADCLHPTLSSPAGGRPSAQHSVHRPPPSVNACAALSIFAGGSHFDCSTVEAACTPLVGLECQMQPKCQRRFFCPFCAI